MFDWLFKLGEVKTAQEMRNLIVWPVLIACYVTQTGPELHFFDFHLTLSDASYNLQIGGWLTQMAAGDWTRAGILLFMFALKASWVCGLYHVLWQAIFALKYLQFEILILLVLFCSSLGFILTFSMVELFALRKWPTAGILNPCWAFGCFAIGLSFHAYAQKIRSVKDPEAPPPVNSEFGYEANPMADKDPKASQKDSTPVNA